jgi:CRISPR system Cascade subunit CasB
MSRNERFIEYLHGLREDRGALAALRRGSGDIPATVVSVYPHVFRFLPREASEWEVDAFCTVASLFALHPAEGGEGRSVGEALRLVAEKTGSTSVEQRFVALLECHREDLPEHLRQAISLVRSHEVPIDHLKLLEDVLGWDWPSRSVQRQWARDYYATASNEADKEEEEP